MPWDKPGCKAGFVVSEAGQDMRFDTTDIGKYRVGLAMLLQQGQVLRNSQRRHGEDNKVSSSNNLFGTACAGQSPLISRALQGVLVGICREDVELRKFPAKTQRDAATDHPEPDNRYCLTL